MPHRHNDDLESMLLARVIAPKAVNACSQLITSAHLAGAMVMPSAEACRKRHMIDIARATAMWDGERVFLAAAVRVYNKKKPTELTRAWQAMPPTELGFPDFPMLWRHAVETYLITPGLGMWVHAESTCRERKALRRERVRADHECAWCSWWKYEPPPGASKPS